MFTKGFGKISKQTQKISEVITPCHVVSFSNDRGELQIRFQNGEIATLQSVETLRPDKNHFLVGKDIFISKNESDTFSQVLARDIAWNHLISTKEVGDTITSKVTGLSTCNVFCNTEQGIDCKIYINDLCLSRIKNTSEIVYLGQKIDVIIKEFDYDNKRLCLDYKNAGYCESDNYKEGQCVEGIISGQDVNTGGYYVSLSKRMVGLIDKPKSILLLSYGDKVSVLIKKITSNEKVKLALINKLTSFL